MCLFLVLIIIVLMIYRIANGAITLGRMLSECFPNTNVVYIFETVRMLSELDFYTECFPFASRMILVCFQNRPNTSRMFTSTGFLPERFPYDFRTLSEYGELKKYIPKLCSEILLFLLRFTASMPGHTMAESPILFEFCGHHRHSERVRYVLGLFGVFGKNTEHT